MPKQSLAQMIIDASRYAAQLRRHWPPNPFPEGIREGSVTDKVLRVLRDRHPQWVEHHELLSLTGASRGAIAWAVRYLKAKGLIRSIPSYRQSNYRRYQATTKTCS